MSKNIKERAEKYFEVFEEWRNEKIENNDYVIKSRRQYNGDVKSYVSTKEELLSFTQCYTDDKTAKYYKARHELPPYWFCSKAGNLITCVYNKPVWVIPSCSGIYRNHEQYEISCNAEQNGICLDPAALVNLTFGGQCSSLEEKRLNEIGLLELKAIDHVSSGQLHHIYGRTMPKNAELEERNNHRSADSDLDGTEFLYDREHKMITNFPSDDKSIEEQIDKLQDFVELYGNRDTVTVLISYGHGKGDILEGKIPDLHFTENGKKEMNSLLTANAEYLHNLRVSIDTLLHM